MPVVSEDVCDACVHQSPVQVPPTLPFILKQFAKAAIRTQPYDLLRWSATYFRALADGEVPPSKVRIEHEVYDTPSGLTPGYLKLLVKQLGTEGTVQASVLYCKWTGVCLNGNCLMEMLKIGEFEEEVEWRHFLAIAAGHLTESLSETMNLLCHLVTSQPAGGPPTVPCETFVDLYSYLARLECGPLVDEEEEETAVEESTKEGEDETTSPEEAETASKTSAKKPRVRARTGCNPHIPGIGPALPEVQIQATIAYMQYWAAKQSGLVMPRNMDHYLCPDVDSVQTNEELEDHAQAVYQHATQVA